MRKTLKTRATPLGAGVIAALLLASQAGWSAQAAPGRATARPARSCPPPKYPGQGYFSELSVSGTSCTIGGNVAIAYYRCRLRHGRAGRCTSSVLGFRCSEVRRTSPDEVNAIVTCRKGRATVTHAYEQFTTG
jgi:hypothetical protein